MIHLTVLLFYVQIIQPYNTLKNRSGAPFRLLSKYCIRPFVIFAEWAFFLKSDHRISYFEITKVTNRSQI